MQDRYIKFMIFVFIIATFLVLLLLGFVFSMLFLHKKKQRDFANELENIKTTFEKELLKTQLEIQDQTFQYISQEIHDNIGQFISLAKLHLNTLNFKNLDLARQQIGNSTDLLTKALDDHSAVFQKPCSSEIIRNNGLTTAIGASDRAIEKIGICRSRSRDKRRLPIHG